MALALSLTAGVLPADDAKSKDAPWIDLLKSVDPAKHTVAGRWRKTDDGLMCNASTAARLTLPYQPKGEYDFRVKFTRTSGVHSIALMFVAGNGQATFEIDAWGQHLAGIQRIDGKDVRENSTRVENQQLENGTSYTALVEVRKTEVRVSLDGKLIATHRTEGGDLSVLDLWRMPDAKSLGIGAYEASTTFESIEVRPASGAPSVATTTTPAPVRPTPKPAVGTPRPATTPSRSTATDLAGLSDEFDDPQSWSNWLHVFEAEQMQADQLERHDIGRTRKGFLTLVPYTSTWYQDYRGILVHKRVSGDFVATTRVRTSGRSGSGAPRRQYSLAGIMVRTPRDVTPQTWRAGGENYIFLSHGAADRPGSYQFEVKTTVNSRSTLQISPAAGGEGEIRTARIGEHFILLRKDRNDAWVIHQRYRRPDMPADLQVGMTVYTDYQGAERLQPEVHNRTVIRNGNPDLVAAFDYFRFARPEVPESLRGRDLSNAAQVPDRELLQVLGK